MARKLSKTEAAKVEWAQQRRYPWDEWTDGNTWELTHGEDFNGGIPQFRSQIYQIAKRRGLDVQVVQNGTKLMVQFHTRVVSLRPAETTDRGSTGSEGTK